MTNMINISVILLIDRIFIIDGGNCDDPEYHSCEENTDEESTTENNDASEDDGFDNDEGTVANNISMEYTDNIDYDNILNTDAHAPLYAGAPISVLESVFAILTLVLSFNITGVLLGWCV